VLVRRGVLLFAGLLFAVLLGVAKPSIPSPSMRPQDGEITVQYSRELDETQVALRLAPLSPEGAPAPPGLTLTFVMHFAGKRQTAPPDQIELLAHAGLLWSPHPELWVRLEERRRMDLLQRRVPGGLDQGGTLMFVPVLLSGETLQQIARASEVSGVTLGFEFRLTAPQMIALREFAARVRASDPSRTDAPQLVSDGSWMEPTTGMTFVRVPAGHFIMGSPIGEEGREEQERRHEVVVPHPFWLGEFEVTQRQWQTIMGDNPSRFADPGSRPVENVNWDEAQAFVTRLSERAPGNRFRLPSEAEWEYACRAGTTSPFQTGTTLHPGEANVAEGPGVAASGATTSVGIFPPNAWGLYDMHGNVWEWTADEHCPYPEGPAIAPRPSCGSPLRVIRGGSWYFPADSARCGVRYTHRPQDRGFSLGLRLVREQLN
jgi:formylglycine-generating enzyme required for sulfatase activity